MALAETGRIIDDCTRFLKGKSSKQDRIVAHYLRGVTLSAAGSFDRAIADLDEAFRLGPSVADDKARIVEARGTVWKKAGELDRALEAYEETIRLSPNDPSGYTNRAIIFYERGQFDRSIAEYGRSIAVKKTAIAYNNRGNTWIQKGDFDRAISDFTDSLRINPKYQNAFSNRGKAWRLKGDLTRALEDQNKAVDLDIQGRGSFIYIARADTLRYMGEFSLAIADYKKSLQNIPEYLPALTGLGLTYEKLGDLAEARRHFEQAAASANPSRFTDVSKEAFETAQARLAALQSGGISPVIAAPQLRVGNTGSIPTPAIAAPILTRPLGTPAAVRQGRRVALVIGNSGYQKVPALANPQKDAGVIAAALRNLGFDAVTLASDATREKLIDALRSFANEAEKADWAMVYYAGHGIEVNGQNFLIPVDARLAADRDVQFEAVPLEQVLAPQEGAKKLKLVLLDACRDNPFAPQMRKTTAPDAVAAASTAGGAVGTRSIGRGLGEVRVHGASLVVFAAKHGQTALDGEGANSPFAVAMVQRIATPGVEINKIFRLVRDDVMEATAGRQEPYTYGSLPGKEDFFFVAAK
ncbi:MAG: tetratricopeptide repeat protein [Bradyrhizobium sp.]|nr:tetratricopeptide repeat protein [Bradyrhizobium sp.]